MKLFKSTEVLLPLLSNKIERIQDEFFIKTRMELKILETFRHPARQQQLFNQGRTAPGNIVTFAEAYESMHQYCLAVDFIVDTDTEKKGIQDPYSSKIQWHILGELCSDYDLEWGGKWGDMGHCEVRTDLKAIDLRKIFETNNPYGIQSVFSAIGGK
jgi:peptidoglycan L-alanyl-D-glutamate endopeptidase CwlK